MRFVYRKERNFHALEAFQKAFVVESLGSHVEQLERSGPQLAADRARLLGRKRGIQPCRIDSPSRKEIDLVFHQSDQGRHDEGNTLKSQRRKLVAERLSAARRKDSQRGLPGAQGVHNRLLTRAELRHAKLFLEQFLELQCRFHLRGEAIGRVIQRRPAGNDGRGAEEQGSRGEP